MNHPSPRSQRRLLIAEDDPDILANLLEFFASLGYEAHGAGTGEAALALALEAPPELIITDLVMPGLSGFQLLEKVAAESGRILPPVIVLSARVESDVRERAAALEVVKFITKPFRLAELREAVASILPL
jgi:CheY-like chemotaxis protein